MVGLYSLHPYILEVVFRLREFALYIDFETGQNPAISVIRKKNLYAKHRL